MRHSIKVLGLVFAAALAVMAVTASAALAGEFKEETEPEVTKTFTELGIAGRPAAGSVGAGTLLTAGGIEISCTSGGVTGEAKIGGGASAEILYNECVVVGAEAVCTIYEDEAADLNLTVAKKEHILATGNGALVLMGGEHFLLVEGLGPGKIFTTIWFHGEECPLPLSNTVSGSTVLALPDLLTIQLSHAANTIAPATLASLFPSDGLFLGTEPAHLAGGTTGSVHLVNDHKWSGE